MSAEVKPVADGIDTERAWRQGRRIYVRCGYKSQTNQDLRAIGAKWDADVRALWVGSGKVDKVVSLLQAQAERVEKVEAVKATGLWLTIPFEASAARHRAKTLGAKWDRESKRWAFPSQEAYDEVVRMVAAHVQEQGRAKATARAQNAEAKARTQEQTEAGVIEKSGRTITGEQVTLQAHLGKMKRVDAERHYPAGRVIRHSDGQRYLVLHTRYQWVSTEECEDGLVPYGWDGFTAYITAVPVEPTEQEREKDAEEARVAALTADTRALMGDLSHAAKAVDPETDGRVEVGHTVIRETFGESMGRGGEVFATPDGGYVYRHPGYYDMWIQTLHVLDAAQVERLQRILAAGQAVYHYEHPGGGYYRYEVTP